MRRIWPFLVIPLALLCAACQTVPVTGRSQFIVVPETTMVGMAADQYLRVKKETPLSNDARQTAMVKRVGKRISVAVEQYLRNNGMADRAAAFNWEFNLFESDELNAWAMPGGKIAFYTGIMPVCRDETGVAVVMAHEIGHTVARHGAERFSHQLVTVMGGVALAVALDEQPSETQAAWLAAYGAGATLGFILPYSRQHEREADALGLTFMAMAGYDPREAVDFWTRMRDAGNGRSPPAFISTHPSHAARIQAIRDQLPEALKHYRPQP